MADLGSEIRSHVGGQVIALADQQKHAFLDGMADIIDGNQSAKLIKLLDDIQGFEMKALLADTPELAAEYRAGAETAYRRMKTVALADKIVANEKAAQMLTNGFKAVMGTVASVTKGVLSVVAQGVVSGALNGLKAGASFDVGGLFPGA